MYYTVMGNRANYRIHAKSLFDAWKYAILELQYGLSGNTVITTIKTEE